MRLVEFRTICRANYRDVDATGRTDPEWDAMLNGVYRDLVREVPFVEEEVSATLAGGSNEIPFSAPVVDQVPPAYYRDGAPIRRVPRRRLAPPARGAPSEFAIVGRKAVFNGRPTSDLALTMVRAVTPAPLVADDDEPAMAEEHQMYIPYMALARAFFADRQPEVGQYWVSEALAYKRAALRAYSQRHRARRGREDQDG